MMLLIHIGAGNADPAVTKAVDMSPVMFHFTKVDFMHHSANAPSWSTRWSQAHAKMHAHTQPIRPEWLQAMGGMDFPEANWPAAKAVLQGLLSKSCDERS